MVRLTPPAGSSSSTRRGAAHERHRDVEQLLLAVGQAAGGLVREMRRAGRSRSSGRRPPSGRHRTGRTAASSCVPWCSWPARIRFSRTDSFGNTCSSWKVRLTPRRLSSDGRMPVTSLPSTLTSPPRRRELAEDAVEQRGLAAAVRADEAEDLALAHVEGDAVDRGDAAEALADVADFEDRLMAASPVAPSRPRAARRRPWCGARQIAIEDAEDAGRRVDQEQRSRRRA